MPRIPGPRIVIAAFVVVSAVFIGLMLAADVDDEHRPWPAAATGQPCGTKWGPAVEIGRIPGPRKEVSGFVSSPRYPGVAWMVRDSGNPTTLYSFEVTPESHQIRSRSFPVKGSTNGDWEDLAYTIGPDGRGRLWISDNINRNTAPKTLWELLEPDPATDKEATVVGRYRWEYPDFPGGNADTETAFFLGGKLTVISKTDPSRVYRFDGPLDPAAVNRPTPVGTVPEGVRMVLGSPSGDERLIVTSSTRNRKAWVYANSTNDVATVFRQPPIFTRGLTRSQREAGDFFPFDGCDIVLLSERQNVWLLPNRP